MNICFCIQLPASSSSKNNNKKIIFKNLFRIPKPQVICQKQASEINNSSSALTFWFDKPLGRFLSSHSLTYSRTQNNHIPVQHVLSTPGLPHVSTAFDILTESPRTISAGDGLLLPTSWFILAFSLLLTGSWENVHQKQARSGGTVQKYLMQFSEIPITFTGNHDGFLFSMRHLILLNIKKLSLNLLLCPRFPEKTRGLGNCMWQA